MNGSFDQCFSKMPEFCEVFERDNPGSFASVQTDDAGHFESIFFGFRAVVEVLNTSGLPVFAIDGAHTGHTSFRGWKLLLLVGRLADNSIITVSGNAVFGGVGAELDAVCTHERRHWREGHVRQQGHVVHA